MGFPIPCCFDAFIDGHADDDETDDEDVDDDNDDDDDDDGAVWGPRNPLNEILGLQRGHLPAAISMGGHFLMPFGAQETF